MASLKEIKNRIASIKSTQKITAAMKMVSSAKLHHTQAATERTLAYSAQLSGILHSLLSAEAEMDSPYTVSREVKNVAIVVCSSNTGLCGSFNANVWKALEEVIHSYEKQNVKMQFYPVGKKIAKELENAGYDLKKRLHISKRAHLILPTHRVLDRAYEAAKGKNKVGTTGKGIGPTYSDKASRIGLRVGDILENFESKYQTLKARHEQILKDLNFTDYDITEEEKAWMEGIRYMSTFPLTDTEVEINQYLKEGKSVLAEGAQGTMLDIDHGTYPFVSSSNTTSGGVCTGLGIGPKQVGEVFGIFKAYSTRVGSGPFPVELFDETGDKIREIGHEYGAVTGRNRRCGWVDLVALKYAIMINGVTQLVMMKSDVLDSFETIKACVAYKKDGVVLENVPFETEGCEAVYKDIPGWQCDLTGITDEKDFPEAFKNYIQFLEDELETPITILSVGPDRAQTIIRNK